MSNPLQQTCAPSPQIHHKLNAIFNVRSAAGLGVILVGAFFSCDDVEFQRSGVRMLVQVEGLARLERTGKAVGNLAGGPTLTRKSCGELA